MKFLIVLALVAALGGCSNSGKPPEEARRADVERKNTPGRLHWAPVTHFVWC